ncbi:hypothetical protein ADL21_11200 [Streptomyces albus subsp. albus]|nr:hypothetical protein ADL21_11200 [Streptomyces albus subsp. albus]
MSNQRERDELTARALTAWETVAGLLRERGETWPYTDASTWGPGLQLSYRYFAGLVEGLKVIGGPDLDGISDLYERRRRPACRR